MKTMVKQVTLAALLLLIVPAMSYLLQWHWQLSEQNQLTYLLFIATQTVSAPWGILTCLLLAVLLIGLTCSRRYFIKQAILLLLVMGTAIIVGQAVKNIVKDQVQEIRPYMVWLGNSNQLYPEKFYQLPKTERKSTLQTVLSVNSQVPQWQQRYWVSDNSYAFPSGHTIFAVTWALLAVGLLWQKGHRLISSGLVVWAAVIMTSRLAIGMHWPQDLAMGVLISWLLTLVFLALFQYGSEKVAKGLVLSKANPIQPSNRELVSD